MAKIKVKNRKALKVAYIEHVGSYETIPFDVLIKRLYAWAKENRVRPGFKPLTIYPDDPNRVQASQLRSWVGIPIVGQAPEGAEVQLHEFPESGILSLKFAAPASEYANSYKELAEFACKEGYEFTGPPLEVYTKKPKVKGGQTIIFAEIQFPIKKA